MDLNQKFFINILSDHLQGISTEIPDDVNWEEILKLSKSHQVEGIVYYQCKDLMPSKIKEGFENKASATLYHYGNRKAALREVNKELDSKEISHIVVKGFRVAEYYPIPALRTMGDCDIIVHSKDMSESISIMRSLGYQGIDNNKTDSWECAKNKMAFDIHSRLVSSADFLRPEQERFFNEYDAYVVNGELEWNFHFLFLIVHLRKHFMNSGVGIRQFIDIAVLIQNCEELDWKWVEDKLAELDLLRFSQSCFYLLVQWFGVKSPISYGPASMEHTFYEKVTEKILQNGIFGKDDAQNAGNYERNILLNSEGWLMFRRIKYFISNVFPPYSYMKTYPGCSYIDGRPYLLIFAWLHRLYYYSKRKNWNTFRRVVKEAFSDKHRLDEQKDFLGKMGL